MMVDKEQILKLAQLQRCENEIAGIDRLIKAVPVKISAIDNELQAAEQAFSGQQEKLSNLKKTYRGFESEVQSNQDKIAKSNAKLASVKTNKEYQSSLKEIEDLEALNSKIEDQMIECLDQMEAIENVISDNEKACQTLRQQAQAQKEELTEEQQEAQQKLADLKTRRDGITGEIDSKVLQKFNTVKKLVGGVAMAQVKNAVCQGCNMNIPPQKYNELQRMQALHLCPSCERILYWIES